MDTRFVKRFLIEVAILLVVSIVFFARAHADVLSSPTYVEEDGSGAFAFAIVLLILFGLLIIGTYVAGIRARYKSYPKMRMHEAEGRSYACLAYEQDGVTLSGRRCQLCGDTDPGLARNESPMEME